MKQDTDVIDVPCRMGRMKVWLQNLKSVHHRIMARFLRKRNWVVFYLEKEHRKCVEGSCWLGLYEDLEKGKLMDNGEVKVA